MFGKFHIQGQKSNICMRGLGIGGGAPDADKLVQWLNYLKEDGITLNDKLEVIRPEPTLTNVNALHFDGVAGTYARSTKHITGGEPFDVTFSFIAEDLNSKGIFSCGGYSGSVKGLMCYGSSSGLYFFTASGPDGGSVSTNMKFGWPISTGVRYDCHFVWDGQTGVNTSLMVAQVGSTTITGTMTAWSGDSADPIGFGGYADGTLNNWLGIISNFYRNDHSSAPMQEGEGTTCYDRSGLGYHLTLEGGVTWVNTDAMYSANHHDGFSPLLELPSLDGTITDLTAFTPEEYNSHGGLAWDEDNGRWIICASRQTPTHGSGGPVYTYYSTDGATGATWTAGVVSLPDKKPYVSGSEERYYFLDTQLFYDENDKLMLAAIRYPAAASSNLFNWGELSFYESDDYGASWTYRSGIKPPDTYDPAEYTWFKAAGATKPLLHDGVWYCGVYETFDGHYTLPTEMDFRTKVWRSYDNMATWQGGDVVSDVYKPNESAIFRYNNQFVMLTRLEDVQPGAYQLTRATSSDGINWSEPVLVAPYQWQGGRPEVIQISEGRLLLVGRRVAPDYDFASWCSIDGGLTWSSPVTHSTGKDQYTALVDTGNDQIAFAHFTEPDGGDLTQSIVQFGYLDASVSGTLAKIPYHQDGYPLDITPPAGTMLGVGRSGCKNSGVHNGSEVGVDYSATGIASLASPLYWQDFVDWPNGTDGLYLKFVQDPSCKVKESGLYRGNTQKLIGLQADGFTLNDASGVLTEPTLINVHQFNTTGFTGVAMTSTAIQAGSTVTDLEGDLTAGYIISAGRIDFNDGCSFSDLTLSTGHRYIAQSGGGNMIHEVNFSALDTNAIIEKGTASDFSDLWTTRAPAGTPSWNHEHGFKQTMNFETGDKVVFSQVTTGALSAIHVRFYLNEPWTTLTAGYPVLLGHEETNLNYLMGGDAAGYITDETLTILEDSRRSYVKDIIPAGWNDLLITRPVDDFQFRLNDVDLEMFYDGSTATPTANRTFTVGARGTESGSFDGRISELTVWGSTGDVVLDAKFDSGTGTTIRDLSPNNNVGIITAASGGDVWGGKSPALANGSMAADGADINKTGCAGTSGAHNGSECSVRQVDAPELDGTLYKPAGTIVDISWADYLAHTSGTLGTILTYSDDGMKLLEAEVEGDGSYNPDLEQRIKLYRYWTVGECGSSQPPTQLTVFLETSYQSGVYDMTLMGRQGADKDGRPAYGVDGGNEVFWDTTNSFWFLQMTPGFTTNPADTSIPPMDWTNLLDNREVYIIYGDQTTPLLAVDSNGDTAIDNNGDEGVAEGG